MSVDAINTLEIIVQRKSGAGWPVVVEYGRAGVLLPTRSEGVFDVDEDGVQQLTRLLGQPRDYGIRLGQALFREGVRDAFTGALRESEDQLRVLLCIEAEDLRGLRWERLGAPIDGGWGVLSCDQRTPFSLYIPSTTDRRFPPIGRRDLRALLLVASPKESERYQLAPFDVEATVAGVKAALGEIPCDVLANNVAGAIGPPDLDTLCARLTDRSAQYTLLHVVCHGKLLDGGETVLYWATAADQVRPVPATELLKRLCTVRGPRGLPHFAFLSTCESAGAGAEGALEGLAQRLVRELGMPAVLAMTEKVTMKTAAALAEAFYRQLGQSGEVDTALPEATAALAGRGDILVPALFSRLGGRPLFSDQLDRELTNAEIKFGLDRFSALLDERAPVLKEEVKSQARIIEKTLGADATALSGDARSERRQALEKVNTLCQEALDLSFNALALGQQPPSYDARCPFRGLTAFRPEDSEFFFGRESLIEQLRQKLAEQNFLPVLGPSGSGKSSLVLAGLIPALRGREKGLRVADFSPGGEPLRHLEGALAALSDQPGVLVVDQFEEVFTLCADGAKRRAFIDKMLGIARSQRVVLTMRADFWGECAPYKDLKEAMEARQSLIATMAADELRRAMDLQAGRVGLRFEAGLSNRILDEVRGEPGAMPLMQHALLELWKRRHGRWLRADEYEAIGGVQKAIARTADDVYDSLSPGEQQQVRNIFVRLTRLDASTVQGERRRDTRRRVWLEDLVPAGAEAAVTGRLVQRLAGQEARLVVTSVDEATQREAVEVAHEALIRHWPRLQGWLDEDRANFLLRDAIHQAAEEWEKHGKEESYLIHRGGRLDDADALSRRSGFLNTTEQDYVKACRDLHEREWKEKEEQRQRELQAAKQIAEEQKARAEQEAKGKRKARRLATVALVAFISLCLGSVLLYWQYRSAVESRQRANTAALARVSSDLQGTDPTRALRFAQAAYATDRSQARSRTSTILSKVFYLAISEQTPMFVAELKHANEVTSATYSPTGDRIVTTSKDGTARLWDAGGKSINKPLEHPHQVKAAAFFPDGSRFVTTGEGLSVKLWDKNGDLIRNLDGHSQLDLQGGGGKYNTVNAVAVSTTGKIVTAGEVDPQMILRGSDGGIIAQDDSNKSPAYCAAFSPDSTRFALCGSWLDSAVYVYDEAGFRFEPLRDSCHRSHGWECKITALGFFPNNNIIWASKDKNLWLQEPREEIRAYKPGNKNLIDRDSDVNAIAVSADGEIFITAFDNGDVVWDKKGEKLAEKHMESSATALALSPLSAGGKMASGSDYIFAVGTQSGTSVLLSFDPKTKKINNTASYRGHKSQISSLSFSPDGNNLLSASQDSTAKIWRVSPFKQPVLPDKQVVAARFLSPDAGRVLTASNEDLRFRIWDWKQGTTSELGDLGFRAWNNMPRIHSLDVSLSGSEFIATGTGQDERPVVWSLEEDRELLLDGLSGISSCNDRLFCGPRVARISKNKKFIVVGDFGGKVYDYDRDDGKINLIGEAEEEITDVDISSDGRYIVYATGSHVTIYDIILKHTEKVDPDTGAISVQFSEDNQAISVATTRSVSFYDVKTKKRSSLPAWVPGKVKV